MRNFFMILATAAAMVFAQDGLQHGVVLGIGVVAADGGGSSIYDETGDVGVGLKCGWNFLIPIEQSVSFHTGMDFNYQLFSESHEDDYDHWLETWQTGLQIPLALRSSWGSFYAEIGARFTLKLGSGWDRYYDDEKTASGSLDDLYKRYHVGMMMGIGIRVNEIDLNVTSAYDLTSVTKDFGEGETRNLTIDCNMIIWFGGKK